MSDFSEKIDDINKKIDEVKEKAKDFDEKFEEKCQDVSEKMEDTAKAFKENPNVADAMKQDDKTAEFEETDIKENKIYPIFSYIWLLVLVPILAARDSKFARFHANQGLVLLIFEFGTYLVFKILSVIFYFTIVLFFVGVIFEILLWICEILFIILSIIGIINAATGKAKELPLFGKIKILK